MGGRVKKFIALIMTVAMLNQLPGFEKMVAYAATNDLYTNYTVTSDTENTQVFISGGVSLTVDSGVTVAGVELSEPGNNNTVYNNGSINTVTASAGELNLNGGYYGTINLSEGAIINANNISAGTLNAYGAIYFEGENSASYFIAQYPSGSGTLMVSNELTLDETQTGVAVYVNKNTLINAPTHDLTLYCNDVEYTIPAGASGTTIAEEYGTYVAFEAMDENISWESADGTGALGTYLMPGETTGKYICTAAEGYCFSDDYATKVNISGSGSNTFDYLSDTQIQISYTVSEYDSGNVTITFPALERLMSEGKGTFLVADVAYGQVIKPQYTSSTQDTAGAVVEYKALGAADSTYSTTVPTAIGSYTARVTIPGNSSYYDLIMTDDFSITKTEGQSQLNVPDLYYGTKVSVELSSGTNAVSNAIIEYKVSGTSDNTYSKTKPTEVGSYVARATLPANDTYNKVVLTDEFSISYMPVPADAYTLVGTLGTNNYYTSAVTVVAKEGYAISRSLDGEYVGQLVINNSTNSEYLYFMDVNTGAKSTAVLISAINIDVTSPEIDAEADKTYYADSLAVAIRDNNLSNIKVNGEEVELTAGNTVLHLVSDGGIEEYNIVVTDRAGNTKNITVIVAAEWTKTGEIPSGTPVKLQAGTAYTLGTGTWTVNGDATSYSGGTLFYVGGEEKYTFNQN